MESQGGPERRTRRRTPATGLAPSQRSDEQGRWRIKISIGLTYIAHAIIAIVVLAVGAILLSMALGRLDFGSGQALGMLVGMVGALPAGVSLLVAAYSAIAVVVTLVRRESVPRDMLLLGVGFIVGVLGAAVLGELEAAPWRVVAYLLLGGYVAMALTLAVRYQAARRHSAP